jgi:hypothetical protein
VMIEQPRVAASSRLRITVGLLILTIACVPPLIRATERTQGPASSPLKIRLNRGFDIPKLKSKITPPPRQYVTTRAIAREEALLLPHVLPPIVEIRIPRSSERAAPRVLRGPPALVLSLF